MPYLTRELLVPERIAPYSWEIIRRGRHYYQEGRVTILSLDDESATCSVRGTGNTYTVALRAVSDNKLNVSCTCPYAAKGYICKHIIAAALKVSERVSSIEDRWDYRLSRLLDSLPKRTAPAAPSAITTPYILIFGLQQSSTAFYLHPYFILTSRWPNADSLPTDDPEAVAQYLERDRSWEEKAARVQSPLDPYACVNLPPEAAHICNLMLTAVSPYYPYTYAYGAPSADTFGKYLLILARHQVPIFLLSGNRFLRRLQWRDRPANIEIALVRDSGGLKLDAGVVVDGVVYSTSHGNFTIISHTPPWVLAGSILTPVNNPDVLSILSRLSFTIPLKEEQKFQQEFLPRLAERLPLRGDVIQVEEVRAEPVPRLYLREEGGTIWADLAFGYGDYEVEANPKATAVTAHPGPEPWSLIRIHRDLAKETSYYQLLTDARYGLKRAGYQYGPAAFQLRARTHPLDFLTQSIPLLTEAGFEIYGEERLRSARLKKAEPVLRVSISSGIDWFDIEAVVQYGDQSISLKEVLKAVRRGERYVKLADGSFGQIPPDWLERYKYLLGLAEETATGLRVRDVQTPLLDRLLEDAAEVQAATDFHQRREQLRAFERITPQPLPQGFQGELRPYQKAGVDWLHFLHEYRFGGILADDMGLGKTVQALVFLQSLKERGEAERASLLVVPRSLLVNWQREAARFTPGLRVLEFMGAGRRKDPSIFDEYDIVLTTYGTMLRDIEFLRSYRFHYAILDESQAIKNPLAKTARAARLLNADHRLVMTGTPVENNTFELWSQFAFVNPGLLGNLESFKENFANPIESRRDEEAASTLRKLVYPFILRRTKAQVAPELPPRTERILFVELEPAQRKLYTRVRDRYRAELLRLIATNGMDDARMKILEGLLRLRQVCIHPALVEPTYRGEPAKFELLFETLETLRSEGHKVLVYSQFVEVLKRVRAGLEERGIPYAYLDGQTRDRQGQVDRFQSDPCVPFFLLSLKAGGVGLNLTAADYVIHLDPWWNPAVEMQAADRAHRIGQEKPVFIYKLIARDTVEEKMLQLQEKKRGLVEQLIVTEESFFKSLTREDVEVLFG
ncbi:MAG: SNF2 helicase associated domain-containing protein [Thermoflexales bacterium]|nr:SNF2 helicase associated domain-containing protein [Thermoflexales bacterium]